jgi:Cu/Ag efflux pump CusA
LELVNVFLQYIGGFVRQYQVQLDPNKLLAHNISLRTVIDRLKASTNEVGGRALDLSGAKYMIRGLGYLRSPNDLAWWPWAAITARRCCCAISARSASGATSAKA